MSEARGLLQQASIALQAGRFQEAGQLCRQFLQLHADRHEQMLGRHVLADVYANQGDTRGGIAELEMALELLDLPADLLYAQRLLSALAHRYADLGDYQLSLQTLKRLAAQAADYGDVDGYVSAFLGVGNLLDAAGEHRRALRLYQYAIRFDERMRSIELRVKLRLHLAACLLFLRRSAQANAVLGEILDLLALEPNDELRSEVSLYQAQAARVDKQLEQALGYLAESERLAVLTRSGWTQAKSLLLRGDCLNELGRLDEAQAVLDQAVQCCRELGLHLLLQGAEEARSRCCEARGDFAGALASERRAHEQALQLVRQTPAAVLRTQILRQMRRHEPKLWINHSRQENAELRDQQQRQQDTLRRLQQEAHLDALTGVYNRRWLDEELVRRAQQRKAFAVLLLDIDHFKAINDQYSHLTGDAVLRQLGEILRAACRQGDACARYGGEEFILLLDEAETAALPAIAERIRRTIARHDWQALLGERPVTASIGVAVWQTSEDPASLLARADAALYRAKHLGRDRVELA